LHHRLRAGRRPPGGGARRLRRGVDQPPFARDVNAAYADDALELLLPGARLAIGNRGDPGTVFRVAGPGRLSGGAALVPSGVPDSERACNEVACVCTLVVSPCRSPSPICRGPTCCCTTVMCCCITPRGVCNDGGTVCGTVWWLCSEAGPVCNDVG
jgi:hypothetical protein